MHYIKLNIRDFIKNQKLLFLVLVFSQILSVVLIFSSYGIINHFNVKVSEVEGTALELDFSRIDEEGATAEKCRYFYSEILPVIECKLDYFFIFGYSDGIAIESETDFTNGKYSVSEKYKEHVEKMINSGRYFNEEETSEKTYVAVIGSNINSDDGIVNIAGTNYKVVGTFYDERIDNDFIFVPYLAFPESTEVRHMNIYLEKPLLKSEYDAIYNAAVKYFDGIYEIPEFDGVDNNSDKRVYQDVIAVAILFIVLSVINYCIMYKYILQVRKDKLAIYRICGCRRGKAFLIYLIEMLGESVVLMGIGIGIFKLLILPKLSSIFEYMKYFFEKETYVKISVLYVVIMLVAYGLLVLRFVKDTPVEMIKEV